MLIYRNRNYERYSSEKQAVMIERAERNKTKDYYRQGEYLINVCENAWEIWEISIEFGGHLYRQASAHSIV